MTGRDNEAYWIARHEEHRHRLAAVGDIARSEEENVALYARKKRRIADVLRELGGLDLQGKAVLDAGCGIGEIAELLHVLGAEVSGLDASPVALEEARRRVPEGDFREGSLVEFDFGREFDVVFAIDVLYHVVDDANWRTAVRRLLRHVGRGGLLIVLDQHKAEPEEPASHVRFRTQAMYDEVVADAGGRPRMPAGGVFLVYRR